MAVCAAFLAGCEGTKLPSAATLPVAISQDNTTGASPVGALAAPPLTQPDQETVTRFRKPSVILYNDANGNDGQRTETASLIVPMTVRQSVTNASRLEVMTAAGPRWISRAEVDLAAKPTENISEIKPR